MLRMEEEKTVKSLLDRAYRVLANIIDFIEDQEKWVEDDIIHVDCIALLVNAQIYNINGWIAAALTLDEEERFLTEAESEKLAELTRKSPIGDLMAYVLLDDAPYSEDQIMTINFALLDDAMEYMKKEKDALMEIVLFKRHTYVAASTSDGEIITDPNVYPV